MTSRSTAIKRDRDHLRLVTSHSTEASPLEDVVIGVHGGQATELHSAIMRRYIEYIANMVSTGATRDDIRKTEYGSEGYGMDWQEKYFDKLSNDITGMKASLRATEERIVQMVN